jgi:hypothetical protein
LINANSYASSFTIAALDDCLTPSPCPTPCGTTDPCLAVTFSIDLSIIAATTTYYLADPKLSFPVLNLAKITPSDPTASCPALQVDIETESNAAIDAAVFTFASDVLDVYTTDSLKINTYNLVLKVKYAGYSY